jgi:OOP family OmpA-OmpF porin
MSDTLFSSFSSTLTPPNREEIAKTLGESDRAVSRGLELATAAVFNGLNRQTGDSDAMRQVIDLASKTHANIVSSALSAGQLTSPTSPLISGGKRFLSSLLGTGQDAILNALSRESGLRASSASTVLALAAQSVLSFIGMRVRDHGMTATALSGFLQSEGASLGDSLPAEFHEAFALPSSNVRSAGPVIAQAIETDPVIAQTVRKGQSFLLWLVPLALILLGLLWFISRPHLAPVAEGPPETPAPVATTTPDLGSFAPRQLADGTMLNLPERGVEGRLLAFIEDRGLKPNKTTWFDFDRLLFSTGSATLQPQSLEQLHNIAAILKAYPATHLTIGGYTDNTGEAAKNLELSQDRANNVTAELVRLGIAKDRLVAKGYGDQHPVADNSTDAGRAQNRRISMLVTQK